MLTMREAFGHATAHDTQATHQAVEQAQRHFDRAEPGDDDPAWVRYFDRTKLTIDTGIALGQLGDATAAEPLIAEGLRSEPKTNQRGRAFHTFWLARTQLQRGDVELACSTTEEAIDLATEVASPRVLAHLREFSRHLELYRSSRSVAELVKRIRSISV